MKGGPRAATALRRRRLDSTCGTTHPGPGPEYWGGWEHPWGAGASPWGGQEHPEGAGSTLGELEHPPRAGRYPVGWGGAAWDAAVRPLAQDGDGVLGCHGAPLAMGGWGASKVLQRGWGGVSHGRCGPWRDTCGALPGWGYQEYRDGYHPTHRIAHPCEETTLREDALAALGKPLFSHRPVSFSNFANSWLVPHAGAVPGPCQDNGKVPTRMQRKSVTPTAGSGNLPREVLFYGDAK